MEKAISVLGKYIDECLIEPSTSWTKQDFARRAFSRWAANELLELFIKEASKVPPHISGEEPKRPIDIVDDFIEQMDYYSELATNQRTWAIFATAHDTIKELRYLFE